MTIEPAGKDLVDRGRLPRPLRRHRARGVRQRAAAQRAVRVPQHPRPEDVDLEGARGVGHRRSPRSSRPSSCACSSCGPRPNTAIEFDPDGTDAIPRLFDESDRLAAATAGREVRGELPPDHERLFAAEPRRARCRRRGRGRRLPPGVQPPRAARADPGRRRRRSASTAEKGAPLTRRERALLEERRAAARAWLEAYAPDRARLAVQRDALPAAADESSTTRSAPTSRPWPARSSAAGVGRRDACRRPSSTPPRSTTCRPGGRSPPSTSHSSAAARARAPAGCWQRSSATSSIGRLREAAAAGVPA